MKRLPSLRSRAGAALLAAAALLLAAGCNHSGHDHASGPHVDPPPAATYKEGHGVQLTAAAARFIGLATGEVGARLPASALLRTARGDFVYVANGGWLLRTPVKVSAAGADGYAIDEGLYEGDRVVTQGTRALWLAELQAINGGVGCADHH